MTKRPIPPSIADASELLRQAHQCESQAQQLEQLGAQLWQQLQSAGNSWSGQAYDSLVGKVNECIAHIRDASVHLHDTAASLRQGAGQIEQKMNKYSQDVRQYQHELDNTRSK